MNQANPRQCQHDGFHRSDGDLASCLRSRVDAYRAIEPKIDKAIKSAWALVESMDPKSREQAIADLRALEPRRIWP